jgi:hypothetical protein
MTIEYIRYQLDPVQTNLFIKSYTQAATVLDHSEYCLAYELTQCEELPLLILFLIFRPY